MPIGLMAITNATLGLSKKTFKAGSRNFAAGVSKLWKDGSAIKAGKAPLWNDDIKGAAQYHRKKTVDSIRSQHFGPSSRPSSTSSWTAHKNSQKGL